MDKNISNLSIRLIEQKDNEQVEKLILDVMGEYECIGVGYSSSDPEVKDMYTAYQGERASFFVITDEEKIYGVGGIAPLSGGDEDTCELRKMYFYQDLRGLGYGRKMMDLLLETAKKSGYKKCYLETSSRMKRAKQLYLKYGFNPLCGQEGNTGHSGCDAFYIKEL